MIINIKNKSLIKFSIIGFFAICFLFNIGQASASSISFSPSSGYYNVGDTIHVKVVIDSDISVNAVSSKITFSTDKLSLSSISKSGSIISLWAQEPSYSNGTGVANLEGVILSGYKGTSGNVATLVFKAKSEGEAWLKFSAAAILANDGQGTDVLSSRINGTLTIAKGIVVAKKVENKEIKESVSVEEAIVDISKDVINKVTYIERENNFPDYSLVFILILVVILLLVLIIIYGIYYIKKLRNYFKNRIEATESDVVRSFEQIENDVNEEISIANKIKKTEALTQEELSFQSQFQKDIKNTKEAIIKEIKDLEQGE